MSSLGPFPGLFFVSFYTQPHIGSLTSLQYFHRFFFPFSLVCRRDSRIPFLHSQPFKLRYFPNPSLVIFQSCLGFSLISVLYLTGPHAVSDFYSLTSRFFSFHIFQVFSQSLLSFSWCLLWFFLRFLTYTTTLIFSITLRKQHLRKMKRNAARFTFRQDLPSPSAESNEGIRGFDTHTKFENILLLAFSRVPRKFFVMYSMTKVTM